MTKKNVAQTTRNPKKPARKPVSTGSRRAAERASVPVPSSARAPDDEATRAGLLADALALIRLAETTFYGDGVRGSPEDLLSEALIAAGEDLDFLGEVATEGGGLKPGHFIRARLRCDLALAIARFRREYFSERSTGSGGAS